jgi:hypothetical protein
LKPKIPIWENFGWPRLDNADIFYGHLEYFTDIWDILWPFDTFFPFLVSYTKKNLATLVGVVSSLTFDSFFAIVQL